MEDNRHRAVKTSPCPCSYAQKYGNDESDPIRSDLSYLSGRFLFSPDILPAKKGVFVYFTLILLDLPQLCDVQGIWDHSSVRRRP